MRTYQQTFLEAHAGFILKVELKSNDKGKDNMIRRVKLNAIDNGNGGISYDKLVSLGRHLFPTASDVGSFRYLDVDGDLVMVTSLEELEEAIQQFKEEGALKLVLYDKDCETTSNIPSSFVNPSGESLERLIEILEETVATLKVTVKASSDHKAADAVEEEKFIFKTESVDEALPEPQVGKKHYSKNEHDITKDNEFDVDEESFAVKKLKSLSKKTPPAPQKEKDEDDDDEEEEHHVPMKQIELSSTGNSFDDAPGKITLTESEAELLKKYMSMSFKKFVEDNKKKSVEKVAKEIKPKSVSDVDVDIMIASALNGGTYVRPFIHAHHQCDRCHQKPIIGKRFHAKNRSDYDLCEPCYKSFDGKDIEFTSIENKNDAACQERWFARWTKKMMEKQKQIEASLTE